MDESLWGIIISIAGIIIGIAFSLIKIEKNKNKYGRIIIIVCLIFTIFFVYKYNKKKSQEADGSGQITGTISSMENSTDGDEIHNGNTINGDATSDGSMNNGDISAGGDVHIGDENHYTISGDYYNIEGDVYHNYGNDSSQNQLDYIMDTTLYNLIESLIGTFNIDEMNAKTLLNISAECIDIKKDYKSAIDILNEVIRLSPAYSDAYYNRGIARYYLNDFEGAVSDYDMCIELNNQYNKAYNNRGYAKQHGLHDYEGAVIDYTYAFELAGYESLYVYNRGTARMELGLYDEAIEDFEKALALNPFYTEASEKLIYCIEKKESKK